MLCSAQYYALALFHSQPNILFYEWICGIGSRATKPLIMGLNSTATRLACRVSLGCGHDQSCALLRTWDINTPIANWSGELNFDGVAA